MNTQRLWFPLCLLSWYVLFSALMAIRPADRQFWIAANILPVALVLALALLYRAVPLSNRSYALITVFLTLHTIGVHYTYSQVPLGGWLQHALHLSRNHFDRLVHFSFGFLMAYPLEEFFRLVAQVRGWLLWYLPVMTILGLSGAWEIIESWVAQAVKPELGLTVLGSQGDVWDAQKDMTAAMYGSILCMVLLVAIRRLADQSNYAGVTMTEAEVVQDSP